MVLLVSNSTLSLVLINHGDISVISKRRYLTVNRRTGILIDLRVAVFVQTVVVRTVLSEVRTSTTFLGALPSSDTSSPISADSRAVV